VTDVTRILDFLCPRISNTQVNTLCACLLCVRLVRVCVRVCVRACGRACVRACVDVESVGMGGRYKYLSMS